MKLSKSNPNYGKINQTSLSDENCTFPSALGTLLAHLSSDQGEPDKTENYTVWLDCMRLSFPWEVIYFSNP